MGMRGHSLPMCLLGERCRQSCDNIANQKLTKDDMLPKIGYVKAGVVEIMQKQQQGYAYVRP
jgi:intracellular sulfur oxidation DsrE/DsrF family protein